MKNLEPIAVLKVDNAELTLPADSVTFDFSESTDPNKKGRILMYILKQTGGDKILDQHNEDELGIKVKVKFPQKPGKYTFEGTVIDRGGLKGITKSEVNIKPGKVETKKTEFGVHFSDANVQDQITLLKKFGLVYIRPPMVNLSTFNGVDKDLDALFEAGMKSVVCANFTQSSEPLDFPKDLDKYRTLLENFVKVYVKKIRMLVCENEPTTDKFFKGKMMDYIEELKVFADICKKYDLECADGAIHVQYVNQMAGKIGADLGEGEGGKGNFEDQVMLLKALKDIPTTYVNLHTNGKGDSFQDGSIEEAVKYVKEITGKDCISNEWHLDNATENTVNKMVNGWSKAGVPISIIWGGGGNSNADPINKGTEITQTGNWYLAAIKKVNA